MVNRPHVGQGPGLEDMGLRVQDSVVYRNLAVFALVPTRWRPRWEEPFLTLPAALAAGSVAVREAAQARVGQLEVRNDGAAPLFLHEGDRLCGGRQDRTVRQSMVLPAGGGVSSLGAFCIEQTRWSSGSAFGGPGHAALAPRSVRLAAKVSACQGSVWREVARHKSAAERQLGARNATSSLNELYASPQVRRASEGYVHELASAVAHPEALGVAFALDGALTELDVYPTPDLLQQLYPRLLSSYALDAILAGGGFDDAPPAARVEAFWRAGGLRSQQRQTIDGDNGLLLTRCRGKVIAVTSYRGRTVHYQVFAASDR